jgi:hypothetical protein
MSVAKTQYRLLTYYRQYSVPQETNAEAITNKMKFLFDWPIEILATFLILFILQASSALAFFARPSHLLV